MKTTFLAWLAGKIGETQEPVDLVDSPVEEGEEVLGVMSHDLQILLTVYLQESENLNKLIERHGLLHAESRTPLDRSMCVAAHTEFSVCEARIAALIPWLKKYWNETNPLLATPPGGESMLDVIHRVRPLISETLASGKNRCFVGRGNLFKAIEFILKEMTFAEFLKIPNSPNGAMTIYRNAHLGKRGMVIDKYHELLCD